MDLDTCASRGSRCRRRVWIVILFLSLLSPAPAKGYERPADRPGPTPSISAPLVVVGWSWNGLFSPVQSALGNRRRMFQLATIGMCLGLYIMMRK